MVKTPWGKNRFRPSYCLEISYVGTPYFGWQSQPHGNTVQDFVEIALAQELNERVRLISASRTDSGVHAAQQFAVFRTTEPREFPPDIIERLNERLPSSIRIKLLFAVPKDFHPCVAATGKEYCYRILVDGSTNPQNYPFHWRRYQPLNVDLLTDELNTIIGTHDFTSFCSGDAKASNRIRTIKSIDVRESRYQPKGSDRELQEIEIRFHGSGFLKQMIRIIVGSAVDYVTNGIESKKLRTILQQRNRRAAGPTAPAQGLELVQILYDRGSPANFPTLFCCPHVEIENIHSLTTGERHSPNPFMAEIATWSTV